MKIFKTLSAVNLFIVLFITPTPLLAQEDVSVEFTFNKPDEYVLEIRNMTDYLMTILFNIQEMDVRSNLYLYYSRSNNRMVAMYHELRNDPNPTNLLEHLDPGEMYRISYKKSSPERWVMARVEIVYGLKTPEPRIYSYVKTIDLNEVRNKVNIPQVLRE